MTGRFPRYFEAGILVAVLVLLVAAMVVVSTARNDRSSPSHKVVPGLCVDWRRYHPESQEDRIEYKMDVILRHLGVKCSDLERAASR